MNGRISPAAAAPLISESASATIDLYWIPLGAGQHVVRYSGKMFEALSALIQRRRRCDLFHSALVVTVPEGRFVIEMTPVLDAHGDERGVVAEGAVGSRWLGHFKLFRYEVRRWREGTIPDAGAARSGVSIQVQRRIGQHLLDLVPSIPTPVWGRDELEAGEMWNSNSVTSWLLTRSGANLAKIGPPTGGRAPGWDSGIVVAQRDRPRDEVLAEVEA
jgi:hypothetical protein